MAELNILVEFHFFQMPREMIYILSRPQSINTGQISVTRYRVLGNLDLEGRVPPRSKFLVRALGESVLTRRCRGHTFAGSHHVRANDRLNHD